MKQTLPTLLALALGLALATPALAGPGGGNGNGPPDRGNPDRTRPGNGNGNGGDRGGPPATPPGRGDNPPPGHGGPNPGNGNGNGNGNNNGGNNGNGHGRGRGEVARGGSRRVCDGQQEVVGPLGQAGNSHVAHVNFSLPEGAEGESWARMMYFWIGTTFDFVLNAHRVEPGSEWTLVARAEDGSAICLADGTANPGGELHLRDSLELDSHLPDGLDPFLPTPEGEDPAGASLELVPTDSADCEAGTVAGDAEGVLVSDEDIRFVDVDEVTCPE